MDELDNLIAEYIDKGVLVPHWDEDIQDFVYSINAAAAKEHAPEFYQSLIDDIDEDLLSLYQGGYVDIEYDENLEASFGLTEKGRAYALGEQSESL